MKKIPVSIGNFKELINDGYVYVDKTHIMYQLLQKNRRYFLSRPRRFGKSLLCSMLGELFAGNKELFVDTWIGRESGYTFKKHPVLSFSFAQLTKSSGQDVKDSLLAALIRLGNEYKIDNMNETRPGDALITLVQELSKQAPVAIIVDEYDAPVLDNIKNVQKAEEIRDILADFFNAMKALDDAGHVHAIFITGVTQFTKTSIFSAMNKLQILSLHEDAAQLLGYTTEEIKHFFAEHIAFAATNLGISKEQFLANLQTHYNGYRFSAKNIKVYNPFSVNNCMNGNFDPEVFSFKNYWAESGTPTFLIELLKKDPQAIRAIERVKIGEDVLQSFNVSKINFVTTLFQTGYLTIVDYDLDVYEYTLDFPNHEVKSFVGIISV